MTESPRCAPALSETTFPCSCTLGLGGSTLVRWELAMSWEVLHLSVWARIWLSHLSYQVARKPKSGRCHRKKKKRNGYLKDQELKVKNMICLCFCIWNKVHAVEEEPLKLSRLTNSFLLETFTIINLPGMDTFHWGVFVLFYDLVLQTVVTSPLKPFW